MGFLFLLLITGSLSMKPYLNLFLFAYKGIQAEEIKKNILDSSSTRSLIFKVYWTLVDSPGLDLTVSYMDVDAG